MVWTEVVCHSLLQWTTICQTSPPWPACLGWPHMAWISFTELDKAAVRSVIRLTSFLWLWFQCVSPLMPLEIPTILLVFLLPWNWGISSRLLQQSTAAAPYLRRGVSPHGHPSWPWMCRSGVVAKRSYPMPEVRDSGLKELLKSKYPWWFISPGIT